MARKLLLIHNLNFPLNIRLSYYIPIQPIYTAYIKNIIRFIVITNQIFPTNQIFITLTNQIPYNIFESRFHTALPGDIEVMMRMKTTIDEQRNQIRQRNHDIESQRNEIDAVSSIMKLSRLFLYFFL